MNSHEKNRYTIVEVELSLREPQAFPKDCHDLLLSFRYLSIFTFILFAFVTTLWRSRLRLLNFIGLLALLFFLLFSLHSILIFLLGWSRSHEFHRLGLLNQIEKRVFNVIQVMHCINERLNLCFRENAKISIPVLAKSTLLLDRNLFCHTNHKTGLDFYDLILAILSDQFIALLI